MGTCKLSQLEEHETPLFNNRSSFEFMYIIGKGGFGKVWKVTNKKTKKVFALKEMDKARIITKKSVNSVMNEKKLLSMLRHPFIVNIEASF
jgi:serum/glucocorticoid-regulated kinase 2